MAKNIIAIIDFGSHAVKCFVYEVKDRQATKVFALKAKTRLGQDLEKSGFIREKSIVDTETLLHEFIAKTKHFPLNQLIAVGTSALRVCQNRAAVSARFSKILNTTLNVLSEHDESVLIAGGFIYKNPAIKDAFLLDLGGGSTELAVIRNGHNEFSLSLPFGAIRVQDKYLRSHPPEPAAIEALIRDLDLFIKANFKAQASNIKAYGLSGGIKTIFKLHWDKFPENFYLPADQINKHTEDLKKLSLEEIKAIPGMPAERADIALAGLLIVNEIIKYFQLPGINWDSSALKDGILAREILKN